MNTAILNNIITIKLIQSAILSTDEDVAVFVMRKKEQIIQNHINNVYPIKETKEGGYYTKLTPNVRGHEHKISAKDIDTLHIKIIAYYLEIDTRNLTAEKVLDMAVANCTSETAKRHRQLFRKCFPNLCGRTVGSITEKDIRKSLQRMIDDGITVKGFNNALSTIKKIYDYCSYEHIDIIDIRKKIDEFKRMQLSGKKVFKKMYKPPSVLAFSEQEAITIYEYALSHPDDTNLAIALLLVTGLRIGELLALTVNDVNMNARTILINKMERTSTREIVDSAKDYSDRIVYMNEDAFSLMQIILKGKTDYLFYNPNTGDKLHCGQIDFKIRYLQTNSIQFDNPAIRSAHDCRRTYASIQYIHGVDTMTIQQLLGHKNVQQTWDYIKDIVESEDRAKKIEKGCIFNTSEEINSSECS